MLCALAIRGLAVIDRLDLELHPGLCVFSGETGAGKSILVGAIGLALGNRAARSLIRRDADRADIALHCDLADQPALRSWLEQRGFGAGDELLLRRTLTRQGASRAYLNDTPASVAALREAGQQIIEIHGQQEHQRLLRREQQRRMLDDACGHADALGELAACQSRWSDASARLAALSGDAERHRQALDLLAFQVAELNALGLDEGAYEELDVRQRTLAGADELRTLCAELVDELYERDMHAVYAQLAAAAERLNRAAQIDPQLAEAGELLPEALARVEEAVDQLRSALHRVDLDPASLAEVEQRLGAMHELARKHQIEPRALWQHSQELNAKLEEWQSPAYDAEALAAEVEQMERDYREQARKISEARSQAAARIAEPTTRILHQLGMPHSEFHIDVRHDAARTPGPHGLDDIEYQIATGPGQTPGPIGAIASGGELSRLSLALQQSLTGDAEPPCMIFDEVDAGIGGGPAETVGQLLARLGERLQVLCVTHLPQVAVQGRHHYCVRKHDAVRTEIERLDRQGRVEELARMFSGIEKTETARQHAEALLRKNQGSELLE